MNKIYIYASIDYVNEYGLENLKKSTKHIFSGKEYDIGVYRYQQIQKLQNLNKGMENKNINSSLLQKYKNKIKELEDEHRIIHEYYLSTTKPPKPKPIKQKASVSLKIRENHIKACLDFIQKFGYESIKTSTEHIYNGRNYQIGKYRLKQRIKFKKLENKQKIKEMQDAFSCIEENYLSSDIIPSKIQNHIDASKDFVKKYGFENLSDVTTYIYKGKGYDLSTFHKERLSEYHSARPPKKKRMNTLYLPIHSKYFEVPRK